MICSGKYLERRSRGRQSAPHTSDHFWTVHFSAHFRGIQSDKMARRVEYSCTRKSGDIGSVLPRAWHPGVEKGRSMRVVLRCEGPSLQGWHGSSASKRGYKGQPCLQTGTMFPVKVGLTPSLSWKWIRKSHLDPAGNAPVPAAQRVVRGSSISIGWEL